MLSKSSLILEVQTFGSTQRGAVIMAAKTTNNMTEQKALLLSTLATIWMYNSELVNWSVRSMQMMPTLEELKLMLRISQKLSRRLVMYLLKLALTELLVLPTHRWLPITSTLCSITLLNRRGSIEICSPSISQEMKELKVLS